MPNAHVQILILYYLPFAYISQELYLLLWMTCEWRALGAPTSRIRSLLSCRHPSWSSCAGEMQMTCDNLGSKIPSASYDNYKKLVWEAKYSRILLPYQVCLKLSLRDQFMLSMKRSDKLHDGTLSIKKASGCSQICPCRFSHPMFCPLSPA